MKSEALQNAVFGLAALALIGVLTFLYEKTQAVDLRGQNEILEYLRELKEIDRRWDIDILRARVAPGMQTAPAIDRAGTAAKALENLAATLQSMPNATLTAGLPELKLAMVQKSQLVEKFKVENAASRAALDGLLRSAAELATQSATLKKRPVALDAALSRLVAAAPNYYWLAQDAQLAHMTIALSDLQAATAALPDALRVKAEQVRNSSQLLLKHRPAERDLSNNLAFLTSGPRLDMLTFTFNANLEATLQDKERFRIYLIYYAGALLILLAFLGARLKAANISLEQRVRERTRELSEALRHLKESEAQLVQSEKMSSLGQMVAGVAHEINTPLAYVRNSLSSVADKLPDLAAVVDSSRKLLALLQAGNQANVDELTRQFALVSGQISQLDQQRVVKELSGLLKDGIYGTEQMAEIIGNLKDFSRLDRSKVTSFNLNDGLNNTLLLAKHQLKSVSVSKNFGDIAAIVCSPSQVNQVFLNLITNAAQAMEPDGGTITLTTRNDGEGVAVEIADTGKGIPPEVLPRIFDPFFTTKEIGKGTGLGLSVSYKIVQQHGGRITVDSQPGAGARFKVWLPLNPPAEADLTA
jgi:two-component system, NtrC family, sensor kinase